MQSKAVHLIGFLCAFVAVPVVAASAPLLYPSRALFEAALGASVTDPYSAAGYFAGDVFDQPTLDRHSDAHMSAVLGETDYTTTGHPNANLIVSQISGSAAYCAGCNGSFRLTLTSTSVGTSAGVFGVGFDFWNFDALTPYHAFFVFGDGSTQDYLLPIIGFQGNLRGFFSLTNDALITSVHLGLANGGTTQGGHLGIDNLTIGAQAIPEPSTFALMALGILMARRRRFSA